MDTAGVAKVQFLCEFLCEFCANRTPINANFGRFDRSYASGRWGYACFVLSDLNEPGAGKWQSTHARSAQPGHRVGHRRG